jgi:hypothetical protein
MSKEQRLIYLGRIKKKTLDKDFDAHYDSFKKKAIDRGYEINEMKIIKERGDAIFYVVIEYEI